MAKPDQEPPHSLVQAFLDDRAKREGELGTDDIFRARRDAKVAWAAMLEYEVTILHLGDRIRIIPIGMAPDELDAAGVPRDGHS